MILDSSNSSQMGRILKHSGAERALRYHLKCAAELAQDMGSDCERLAWIIGETLELLNIEENGDQAYQLS